MTNFTTLGDLKIGDKLPDTKKSKYGHYTNRSVISIRSTKTGRIAIKYSYTYINNEKIINNGTDTVSHKPLNPNTLYSEYFTDL